MKFIKDRSRREFLKYEEGLDRRLWKHLKLSGYFEKEYRLKFVKNLFKGKKIKDLRILELGGSKWIEIIHDIFEDKPRELVCINISPSEIRVAKEEAELLNTRYKPDWKIMDAHKLEFEEGYFDIVIGYGMLHHLELVNALSEVKRVLKKDGIGMFREPLDINPILQLGRYLTPQARTEDEVPFKKIHLKQIESLFPKREFIFEQFLTLFVSPLINFIPNKFSKLIMKLSYGFDRFLLKIYPNTGYYFRSVFIMIKKD